MTNQEIDDFIAEKVMLWRKWELKGYPSYWENVAGTMQITCDEWDPTTDLNQAVQAAEKKTYQHASWHVGHYPEGYVASCGVTTYRGGYTPADALARAVVKATGGTDEH